MVANLRHSEVGANGEIMFLYLDMVKDHYIDRKWYKYVEYTSANSKFQIWSSYAYFGGGQSGTLGDGGAVCEASGGIFEVEA